MHCLGRRQIVCNAFDPIDDADIPIEDSTPLKALVEGVEESHSPSPQDDERNREYLIRRAGLGGNTTQEEMDAVVVKAASASEKSGGDY